MTRTTIQPGQGHPSFTGGSRCCPELLGAGLNTRMTDVALSRGHPEHRAVRRGAPAAITLLNYQRQLDAIIALAGGNRAESWQQCDAAIVQFAVRSRRKGLVHQSGTSSRHCEAFDWLWPVSQGRVKANPARASRERRVICRNIDVDGVNRLLDIVC